MPVSPPDPPAFLADRMLIRLARWLRAAGYDTSVAEPGRADRALMAEAVAGDRLLLTCDRKLAEFRAAPGRVVILPAEGVAKAAEALTRRCAIDWLMTPFSRCLLCNVPVEAVAVAEAWPADRVWHDAFQPLTRCPDCGRLYWQGGHVARMRTRLARWRQGDFA
ncbi:MAG: Mut7-C RNAse domain-containing protein [Candidatus Eiseniibacteriota bacterium]